MVGYFITFIALFVSDALSLSIQPFRSPKSSSVVTLGALAAAGIRTILSNVHQHGSGDSSAPFAPTADVTMSH